MLIEKGKHIAIFLGTVVLPGMVIGSLFVTSNPVMKLLKADGSNIVLDSNTNLAFDENGNGTFVDAKGITWEYHNASSYSDGLITLKDRSYFGISSSTAWGITGISNVTANFTGNELWLLTSTDGIEWHEQEILTSGQSTSEANNWRYIRFYNYENYIDIDSIHINYSCTGVTGSEDIDAAFASNVLQTYGLTYASETSDLSPRGNSREAIKFTKKSGSTWMKISLGKDYRVGDIAEKKVEFDLKGNVSYSKTLQLYYNDKAVGGEVASQYHTNYKTTPLGGDWYHIEVPVSALAPLISGYRSENLPEEGLADKLVNAIRINAGGVIIDNLRIGSSDMGLGLSNKTDIIELNKKPYWLKVGWVGKLYGCTITFDDDTLAEQVAITDPNLAHASPFYIRGLQAGTVVATARVVYGYNRRVATISKTLIIK